MISQGPHLIRVRYNVSPVHVHIGLHLWEANSSFHSSKLDKVGNGHKKLHNNSHSFSSTVNIRRSGLIDPWVSASFNDSVSAGC